MEPSPAWASRPAERDLHTVTNTTCARCHNAVDNLPNADQPPLDFESVVLAHLRPGPAYACANASYVQHFCGHRCQSGRYAQRFYDPGTQSER